MINLVSVEVQIPWIGGVGVNRIKCDLRPGFGPVGAPDSLVLFAYRQTDLRDALFIEDPDIGSSVALGVDQHLCIVHGC